MAEKLEWTDIHCHLDKLEITPDEAIAEAKANGLRQVFTIGTDGADHPVVLALAQKYSDFVRCTLGVHPHDAKIMTPEVGAFMKHNFSKPEVVAVGEIGLDYYYNQSPKDQQIEVFESQLQMAVDAKLPVQIHTRDAEQDTITVLNKFRGRVQGVIHCFTGTMWLAEQALDLGFNISFSGIVTFKNAEELRKVVVYTPLDRLHVETDSPFLAPVPMRGKKNQPSYMVHTAQVVADLKQTSLENLSLQTQKNTRKMFPKSLDLSH